MLLVFKPTCFIEKIPSVFLLFTFLFLFKIVLSLIVFFQYRKLFRESVNITHHISSMSTGQLELHVTDPIIQLTRCMAPLSCHPINTSVCSLPSSLLIG